MQTAIAIADTTTPKTSKTPAIRKHLHSIVESALEVSPRLDAQRSLVVVEATGSSKTCSLLAPHMPQSVRKATTARWFAQDRGLMTCIRSVVKSVQASDIGIICATHCTSHVLRRCCRFLVWNSSRGAFSGSPRRSTRWPAYSFRCMSPRMRLVSDGPLGIRRLALSKSQSRVG
ncbi:hypothetical protein LZ30DRAFT_197105 [Colletotrichum cereale]|nr:hypothetical protein LZ30DRAFT_197105 [Colletotrichum cereale]